MKDGKQLEKLLHTSREMFMKHGVKNLTMDDIAKEMGVSKKTIYQFVENKSDLVKLALQNHLDEEKLLIKEILKKSTNSVEEMITLIEYFMQVARGFNTEVLYDLQKYYPEAWNLYNEYRFGFMLGLMNDNLQNGVKQGLYRSDMDTDIISRIYVTAVDFLTDQEFFPAKKYAFVTVFREFLRYHLRGIVSAEGLKLLEQHNLFKS